MPVTLRGPAPAEGLALLCLDTHMLMVYDFVPTAWFILDFKYRTWFILISFFTFVLSSLAVEGLVRRIINVWLITWIPTAHPRQCFLTANPALERLRDKFANVRRRGPHAEMQAAFASAPRLLCPAPLHRGRKTHIAPPRKCSPNLTWWYTVIVYLGMQITKHAFNWTFVHAIIWLAHPTCVSLLGFAHPAIQSSWALKWLQQKQRGSIHFVENLALISLFSKWDRRQMFSNKR